MRKPLLGLGLSPSPSPSNGEGGRTPGKSRLPRKLSGLPVGRSSRSTPFNLRPNQTKSDQIKPKSSADLRHLQRHFNHSIHSTTTHYIKSVQISHGEKFE